MEKSDIKQVFSSHQWCKQLPPDVVDELIDLSTIRTYMDGQVLYVKNDPAEGVYGVLEGTVRVGACSAEGKQTVYTIVKAGTWLGYISMFDGQPRLNDADALGRTEILFVPREKFHQLLEQRPELYKFFTQQLCLNFRRVTALIEDRNFRGFQERLARQLVLLVEQHGELVADGVEINLRLPQEELASLVGTTRQRINKVLKDWQRNSLIEVKYSRITIKNKAALEALIHSV